MQEVQAVTHDGIKEQFSNALRCDGWRQMQLLASQSQGYQDSNSCGQAPEKEQHNQYAWWCFGVCCTHHVGHAAYANRCTSTVALAFQWFVVPNGKLATECLSSMAPWEGLACPAAMRRTSNATIQ